MLINGYEFQGPFPLERTEFNPVPAVYVVSNHQQNPVDVGQTNDLKQRMSCHEREYCWKKNAPYGPMVYAFVHDNEQVRLNVESKIRDSYQFACGIR